MNELEELRERLIAEGYFPEVSARRDGWECTLWNSVNVGTLKPQHQPRGQGVTAVDAVHEAIRLRDARLAKLRPPALSSALVSGLPR